MASIGTGGEGHGGKKSVDSEIPLVPFIDLLLCCIMFLLVTAVWNQLASVNAQMNAGGDPVHGIDEPPPPIPMQIHVTPTGYTIGSDAGDRTEIGLASDQSYDLAALHEHLQTRHGMAPGESTVVLSADDGVDYADLIAVMDACVANHFPNVTMTGEGL